MQYLYSLYKYSHMKKETIPEGFKKYLETLGYSESTCRMLPACLAEFMEFTGDKEACGITAADIANYHEHISTRPNKRKGGGLSAMMIHHHIYALRLYLNLQEQQGTVKENPISGLSFPKPEGAEREVLTVQEIKELYGIAETSREKAVLGIFYGCGLRRSEGEALNIKDVNLKTNVLYVREGKGKKRREVPVSRSAAADIRAYLQNERKAEGSETALITNSLGTRTRGNCYNKIIKSLADKAGIEKEITLHCLRHSIATHLLENGMSVEYVRDFLGHKHLDATQIYTRVSAAALAKVEG